VDGQWVPGIISRTTGEMRLEIVPNRTAAVLLPLIESHVAPHSIIMSDEWAAYRQLQNINNYTHMTINHSVNCVNPVTGANTQRIESNWRAMKRVLATGGHKRQKLADSLAEYLWRREYYHNGDDPFKQLILDISRLYNH